MYSVYILRSSSNQLHIGQTTHLDLREKQQLLKTTKAAKFIKDGKEFKLVYHEEYTDKLEAMNREKFLKSGRGREFLKYNNY